MIAHRDWGLHGRLVVTVCLEHLHAQHTDSVDGDWSGWQSLGGPNDGSQPMPALPPEWTSSGGHLGAATGLDGCLDIFSIQSNGSLIHFRQQAPNGHWNAPVSLGVTGVVVKKAANSHWFF